MWCGVAIMSLAAMGCGCREQSVETRTSSDGVYSARVFDRVCGPNNVSFVALHRTDSRIETRLISSPRSVFKVGWTGPRALTVTFIEARAEDVRAAMAGALRRVDDVRIQYYEERGTIVRPVP